MKLQKLAALGAATLAALGLTVGAASPALAHDELINTALEVDSATGELNALAFVFSNDIMQIGTEIIVTDAADKNVATAAPEVSGPNVRQPLDAPLAAGAYNAVWRVVSSDGHPIEGGFVIEVAEDGGAEITATSENDPRFADESEATEGETGELTTAAREQSSFPAGGWIALAAVVVVGVGTIAVFASRGRKKTASAQAATDAAGVGTAGAGASAGSADNANQGGAAN